MAPKDTVYRTGSGKEYRREPTKSVGHDIARTAELLVKRIRPKKTTNPETTAASLRARQSSDSYNP